MISIGSPHIPHGSLTGTLHGVLMTHTTADMTTLTTSTATTPVRAAMLIVLIAATLVVTGLGAGTSLAQPAGENGTGAMGDRMAGMTDADMEQMVDHCSEGMEDMAPQMDQMMRRADRNGMQGMMGSSMMNGMMR